VCRPEVTLHFFDYLEGIPDSPLETLNTSSIPEFGLPTYGSYSLSNPVINLTLDTLSLAPSRVYICPTLRPKVFGKFDNHKGPRFLGRGLTTVCTLSDTTDSCFRWFDSRLSGS